MMYDVNYYKEINKQLSDKVDSLSKEIEELKKDSLTNMYTKRTLQPELDIALYELKRYKEPFTVVVMDLDKFKPINDNCGHLTGDNVLRDVSTIILKSIRKSDIAIRFGGDEFIIIFKKINETSVESFMKRISITINKLKYKCTNGINTISISYGIYQPNIKDNPKSIIDKADTLMYMNKTQRR